MAKEKETSKVEEQTRNPERKTREGKASGKKKKKKKAGQAVSFWMMVLQLISSILLGVVFFTTGLFPMTYLLILVVILFVLMAVPLALQSSTPARIFAIIYSLVVSGVLMMGTLYLWQTNQMLHDITLENQEEETKLEDVAIIVMSGDPAQTINDTATYTYGIQSMMDRANTDVTLKTMEENIGNAIKIQEYDSLLDQVDALYSEEIGAMIINERFRTLIMESYESFNTDTRVLSSYQYKQEEPEKEEEPEEEPEEEAEESSTFSVFLSGIDTFGGVTTVSRSDVNIIATVNPDTKQILLLTTPRDYYVELPFYDGCMDKLTHAGIYGVETSMETLENLYGIEINNYAKINFTGFQTLVNSLGGVEVYCQIPFSAGGYSFQQGYNYVDGDKALVFVRERYSFGAGDLQRGRNQMEMIKALINKIVSPSILTNYSSFMSSISSFITTDMDKDMIAELVKGQLADGGSWNIVSYNVSGSGTNSTTYSMGSRAVYVMIPDQSTVNTAKELLRQVHEGETLTPVQ